MIGTNKKLIYLCKSRTILPINVFILMSAYSLQHLVFVRSMSFLAINHKHIYTEAEARSLVTGSTVLCLIHQHFYYILQIT